LEFDHQSTGGDAEYCDDNGAQLGRISVFYYEASSGKYAPRALLIDLEPDVIGAVSASPLGELLRPGSHVNQNAARVTTGLRATTQGLGTNSPNFRNSSTHAA
jgi:hypothetical protein